MTELIDSGERQSGPLTPNYDVQPSRGSCIRPQLLCIVICFMPIQSNIPGRYGSSRPRRVSTLSLSGRSFPEGSEGYAETRVSDQWCCLTRYTGNIIAALSTGSGKTLISVLLIKWITSRLQYKKKPVIFLVPKVTLVDQQARYLEEKTGLKVARLYGSLELDLSDRDSWTKRFTTHPVLVMTRE